MEKRKVSYKIFFKILKINSPVALVGIIFLAISIFGLIPMVIAMSAALTKPYEKYDFDKIKKYGTEKTAIVTSAAPLENVTVNNEHPVLIAYQYSNGGKQVSDKFETLDLDKASEYHQDSEVKILTYEGESMIKGLEPFSFPSYVFLLFPAVFFLIGGIFTLLGLRSALRIFKLYKTGTVRDAWIVSMEVKTRRSKSSTSQFLLVHYYYLDAFKSKIFGQTLTNDMLMMNGHRSGDMVKIFVSDENEKNSCLVPKLDAMQNSWDVKF